MKPTVKFLGSGSAGNSIVIDINGMRFMVDCGIPKTKIEKRLAEEGIQPGSIDAIFITHAHGDHIKGLPMAKKHHISVYATPQTHRDIDFDGDRMVIESGDELIFGNVNDDGLMHCIVGAFKTHHDTRDSLGYTFTSKGHKVSVCLDTGRVDFEMLKAMQDSDIYVLEANYSAHMMQHSDYHEGLKARITGDLGHLSNEHAARALVNLVKGRGEDVYLCHLSSNNNMPLLAKMTVLKALAGAGVHPSTYKLEVIA